MMSKIVAVYFLFFFSFSLDFAFWFRMFLAEIE